MNLVSKKKMLQVVSDLQDAVKSVKEDKSEVLAPSWTETIGLFLALIHMLGDHLRSQEGEYDLCLAVIQDVSQEGQTLIQGAPNPSERQRICKELKRLLKKLQFELKKSLPEDKKELVFFPYLYAMWDSLESVWRAAVESGEYEVSVVPIPYYSKEKDGSLGEMHYDGALYPEEVAILPWETYQIEERKPHVAYVHNPYDYINLVTSVHPDFYVEKLKPHVGSLVYIPYFIAMDEQVDSHFMVTPVTMEADKIIVQSEEVRTAYIEAMYSFKKAKHPTVKKSLLEDKVLALGSPKLDGKERSKESLMKHIPAEWHPLLRKIDGTFKQIVFFNISLGSLLANPNAIEKWSHALDVFRQESEEIALWFRPHPLILSTLVSMRPGTLQAYEQMVEAYQKAGWGIFDNCVEFSIATECCDSYYGDPSSVAEVFRGQNKPVMIQNYAVMKERDHTEGGRHVL